MSHVLEFHIGNSSIKEYPESKAGEQWESLWELPGNMFLFEKNTNLLKKNNYKNNSANTEEFKIKKKKEKGNIFLNQITQRMNTVNILQTLFQI